MAEQNIVSPQRDRNGGQASTPKIRVLIVDDFPVVRAGIRNLLEANPDIQVLGEAANGQDALRLASELAPDILILDMELPDINGYEVASRLIASHPSVRILALSAHTDRQFVLGLLELGAAGYLVKDEVAERIVEAVRGVARGEQGWISRAVSAQLPVWLREKQKAPLALTARELEVLRCIVDGLSNHKIALQLGIHEKTVEKHIDSIFKQLQVSSRVEAAVVALREKLI